jgi:hypothetical protein
MNSRCKSRLLLRCKVTLMSRIPRSIVISKSGTMADIGNSRTVPVFVLDSHPTDILPADEDPILPNGNPHPEVPIQVGEEENADLPGHFEDVGDLQDIQQNNID